MKSSVVDLLQFIYRMLGRLRVLWTVLLSALLLSGCVQYDVGVNFEGQHRGAIAQHIKLGEQLTSFSNEQAQEWLKSIEHRARQLQGKTKRLSDEEIVVTIPFSNGTELESKFNQFFNPVAKKTPSSEAGDTLGLPSFDSKLHLRQSNLFLVQRNKLSFDVDLRSLGVVSASGNVIVSPSSLLDLQFSLQTPWGARTANKVENAISPEVYDDGHQLVWKLQPGQLNHIEAVFWLPSPLGVGTLAIILLVLAGFYVKYKSFPWTMTQSVAPASLSKVQS